MILYTNQHNKNKILSWTNLINVSFILFIHPKRKKEKGQLWNWYRNIIC